MNDFEASLQKMRANYHQLRYPGNLACDVLRDSHPRNARRFVVPVTVAAVTILLMAMIGLLMLLPRAETPDSAAWRGEATLMTAGSVTMNLDMSGMNLLMTKPDIPEPALTGDMGAGTLPALGSLSLYELVREDLRQLHSAESPEHDN